MTVMKESVISFMFPDACSMAAPIISIARDDMNNNGVDEAIVSIAQITEHRIATNAIVP